MREFQGSKSQVVSLSACVAAHRLYAGTWCPLPPPPPQQMPTGFGRAKCWAVTRSGATTHLCRVACMVPVSVLACITTVGAGVGACITTVGAPLRLYPFALPAAPRSPMSPSAASWLSPCAQCLSCDPKLTSTGRRRGCRQPCSPGLHALGRPPRLAEPHSVHFAPSDDNLPAEVFARTDTALPIPTAAK